MAGGGPPAAGAGAGTGHGGHGRAAEPVAGGPRHADAPRGGPTPVAAGGLLADASGGPDGGGSGLGGGWWGFPGTERPPGQWGRGQSPSRPAGWAPPPGAG